MKHKTVRAFIAISLSASFMFAPLFSLAQSEGREYELQQGIAERTTAIQELEKEIAKYQAELKTLDGAKKTLQNEIKSIDITRAKLAADLSVTENKIGKTNLELESLAIDIRDKEGRIDTSRAAIALGLKIINEYDEHSFLENLLSGKDLTEAWETVETIQTVQDGIKGRIETLSTAKTDLEDRQTESTRIKNDLTKLRTQLANQKSIIDYNKKQKNDLLAATKNNEANYQKILNEKTALRDAFEQELLDFESELRLLKDPSSIPDARHSILAWPLESILVTQYFGNTKFARDNPQVYNGNGHNGVDFRASVGTPVKAVREGEVMGTGNTDTACPNASYGKWVLIEHDNGLSTLYAHLSVISVAKGDAVSEGTVIGYSGNTGYSTGPHLHFTVYATQGVIVAERKSKVCKGTYTMPIADLRAYLNPISYLPELP